MKEIFIVIAVFSFMTNVFAFDEKKECVVQNIEIEHIYSNQGGKYYDTIPGYKVLDSSLRKCTTVRSRTMPELYKALIACKCTSMKFYESLYNGYGVSDDPNADYY